ncbi:MAG: hypothetical protein AB7F40_05370 [Victivallaceae bacterium]|nr:hypothetical protein [Victivallaceae bacterium]
MNKMFKFIAAVTVGAMTFTAPAAEGSFDGMSKFVSKSANSLGYVDVAAFRGNKIMKAGIDKVPVPGAAEISDTAIKLMDVFDAAMLYGNSGANDEIVLLVYSEKLTDIASLEVALKAALPEKAGKNMSIADVDGRKVLKVDGDDGPGFVEVEPGLFLMDDIDAIAGDLAAEKGLDEQLAARLAPYAESKAFGVVAVPADEAPFMEYGAVTFDPTGDDGVKFFNTFVLGEGLHVDSVCEVNSTMVDKLITHVLDWYQKSMISAMQGNAVGQDQDEDVEEEEVEIDEATE